LDRRFRIGKRGTPRRALNHAGNERCLTQIEIRDVLAEEDARRFSDTVHRERPALTEVDVIEIELEDLFLRRASLEDERHHDLAGFSQRRDRAALQLLVELVFEEEHARQLLRDRARAARTAATEETANRRGDRPEGIHAGM